MTRLAPRQSLLPLMALVSMWIVAPAAHAASDPLREPSGPGWVIELLDGKGHVVDLEQGRPGASGQPPAIPALPADIPQLRRELDEKQKSTNPRAVKRAQRLLPWLDILEARTPAEQHERIRRLPVSVVTSAVTEGDAGVMREFVAGGKTRVRAFVPSVTEEPANEAERQSGPSAEEECFEGEPGPCATEEEMIDLLWVIAYSMADQEYTEAEFNAAYWEYEGHCSQYPWSAGCGNSDAFGPSGPSDCSPNSDCWGHAAASAGALWVWADTGVHYWGKTKLAAASGKALPAGKALLWKAGLVGLAFTSGYAVGSFIDCQFIARMAGEPVP